LPCADGAEEARLVAEAKTGNPAALAALYEGHRDRVYDLAFALTGNHEDAEDVRQMTFVRAFLGLGKFRGESAFRTWLVRICVNTGRSARRPAVRRAEPVALQQDCVDPGAEAHRRLRAEEIRRRIASLPRWAAELIALCDLQGLSYREIAGVLGCSCGGIGPRLHRARRMLKERLEGLA